MDENEIDMRADELFEPFGDLVNDLTNDDALSLAEAMEIRFSNFADAVRYDLRNHR